MLRELIIFLPSHIVSDLCLKSYQSENMKERNHLDDLGLDGRVVLKWFLNT